MDWFPINTILETVIATDVTLDGLGSALATTRIRRPQKHETLGQKATRVAMDVAQTTPLTLRIFLQGFELRTFAFTNLNLIGIFAIPLIPVFIEGLKILANKLGFHHAEAGIECFGRLLTTAFRVFNIALAIICLTTLLASPPGIFVAMGIPAMFGTVFIIFSIISIIINSGTLLRDFYLFGKDLLEAKDPNERMKVLFPCLSDDETGIATQTDPVDLFEETAEQDVHIKKLKRELADAQRRLKELEHPTLN